MNINQEQIETSVSELMDYCSNNPGVLFGKDYAEFALLLKQNKKFNDLLAAQTAIIGLLISLQKPSELTDMKKSPMFDIFAPLTYLGYKLAKAAAETEILEKMVGEEKKA